MAEWPVLESVTEYDTPWYTGGYDLVEQPDGSTKKYYWAELPPAAIIIAITDGDVVFVEQYRPVIREACLELPAGIVEDQEDFTEAGARELEEETGFWPGEVELLESFWTATGVLRHRRGVVVASGLTETGRALDSNEFIDLRRVPVDEAVTVAREAPVNDATLEGVLLAQAEGIL